MNTNFTKDAVLSIARPRHLLAMWRGVSPGAGCSCAVCGNSPFDPGPRPIEEVLTDSFSDHGWLLSPSAAVVCAGCQALLGGKPGDDPPPARMQHVIVSDDGTYIVLDKPADVAAVLMAPPACVFVLVWSGSRQKHAWLRAGLSTADRIIVGTDDGPVAFEPSDRRLLETVSELLAVFGRDEVESGTYAANRAPAEWLVAHEAIVSPYRPSLLLSMLCRIAPRGDTKPAPVEATQPSHLAPDDTDAVCLLASLALGSEIRRTDGIMFWRGMFAHRVARFARLPLADFVSRMLCELRVPACGDGALAAALAIEEWPPERQVACSRALRVRGALLVTLAFGAVRAMKEGA